MRIFVKYGASNWVEKTNLGRYTPQEWWAAMLDVLSQRGADVSQDTTEVTVDAENGDSVSYRIES